MTPLHYVLLAVFASLWLVPLGLAGRWEYHIRKLSAQAAQWDAAAKERP